MNTNLRKIQIHNNSKRAKGQATLQYPDKQNQYWMFEFQFNFHNSNSTQNILPKLNKIKRHFKTLFSVHKLNLEKRCKFHQDSKQKYETNHTNTSTWHTSNFTGHREESETFTCSLGIQCSRMTCFIHFQYSLDPCNYFMRTWISRLVEVEVSWTHIFTYVPLKWWSSKWQGGVVICPATQLVKVLECDRIKVTDVVASRLLFTMSNKRLATFSKSGHCDVSRGGISSDDLSW